MNKEIIIELFKLQDKKYQEFHSKLCPRVENIIGVRLPLLRKMAKDILKGNWQAFLENVENKYYEETMLEGLVISGAKIDFDEKLKLIKGFIPKINNWAICDTFCANIKPKEEDLDKLYKFSNLYLKSEREFDLRFVVVIYLDYFLTDKYIDEVLKNINQIKHDGYYVKMAVAWAVSFAYIKQKEKTDKFLQLCTLDDITYNKAIQKIIESNRISKDEKEMLKLKKR